MTLVWVWIRFKSSLTFLLNRYGLGANNDFLLSPKRRECADSKPTQIGILNDAWECFYCQETRVLTNNTVEGGGNEWLNLLYDVFYFFARGRAVVSTQPELDSLAVSSPSLFKYCKVTLYVLLYFKDLRMFMLSKQHVPNNKEKNFVCVSIWPTVTAKHLDQFVMIFDMNVHYS